MQATPGMMTWQIFADTGNNFRWELSGRESATRSEEPKETLIPRDDSCSRIPSMADLLFQGYSKILENSSHKDENSPMFQTGLGKSVSLKQSSIIKALSILSEEDAPDQGQSCERDNGCSLSNSLFQTGSGRAVNISSAGLTRAKTLLGLEENYSHCTSRGLEHTTKLSASSELYSWGNSLHLEKKTFENNRGIVDVIAPRCQIDYKTDHSLSGVESKEETFPDLMQFEMCKSASKMPPIKFQTAGGRSISISSDALQRARSLLRDPDLSTFPSEGSTDNPFFSFTKEKGFDKLSLSKENDPYACYGYQGAATSKHISKRFLPLEGPSSYQQQSSALLESNDSRSNLLKKVDADDIVCDASYQPNSSVSHAQKPLSNGFRAPHTVAERFLGKDISSRVIPLARLSGGPLVDISNNIGNVFASQNFITGEKRRLGRKSSISPFKRPRSSRFSTPFNNTVSSMSNGSYTLTTSENSCTKTRVSTRYPFQVQRTTVKEFFGGPPCHQNLLEHLPYGIKRMNADNAEKYKFHNELGLDSIEVKAFCHMLELSGASMLNASQEWVANHYKWIVWKLACYERCYPAKASGKYLTVSNVLEELKYRYEREINHGHSSALKRILEGDASPASMVVLCISSIHSFPDTKLETGCEMVSYEDTKKLSSSNCAQNRIVAKIELTDGWYSLDALLDASLSKQLIAGKLFVGQKLRIWGAGLCGWGAPVSPLEASKTVNLLLHINGTYRAHWADRLGFCKGLGAPLAFRCIKSTGGMVPRTFVGITRIYPMLYKERLTTGGSIVRSERLETRVLQLYNQRRSTIAEGFMSEFEKGIKYPCSKSDSDTEEGAKLLKILETAAEPEVIMAGMSSDQLTLFAAYQAKQVVIRQSDMQKGIEKALEDAGLGTREVTPFMRVRVVGLTRKASQIKVCPRAGLITIWNPTEKQQLELVEGQAYAISGLTPLYSDSDTIYLRARGSSSSWQPLPPLAIDCFEPFFAPRKSVLMLNLGEVPLASEFDIAAVVVYVGETYTSGHQKKQWVFVTDGSVSELQSEESLNCLLAISFCSPVTDNDSFAPINNNLAGSTVGFCNLIKRARDQTNHLWVAEATENSTYFLSYDHSGCSHLKEAAGSAHRWAKISSLTIQKLKQKVLYVIGGSEG